MGKRGGIASIEPQNTPDLRLVAKPETRGPRQPDEPSLPPGCPVKPLGRLGSASFYLDELGQLARQGTKDWNDVAILTLFGRQSDWLEDKFPRYGKPEKDKETGEQYFPVVGFDYAAVKKSLIDAASRAGIFDPQGRVRGRGAHRGDDGELVLHCGDAVLIAGARRVNGETLAPYWHEPGVVDGYVYETKPAIPRPAADHEIEGPPGEATLHAALELLKFLKTWNWVRPLVDPMLLFGEIGAMMIAGGLTRWRPHIWVTGSRGTGKSTLIGKDGLIDALMGSSAIFTADATEAAIRQITGAQTLPIVFDELEASAQNDKSNAIIRLARLASSGADIYRGSASHEAASFKAQTCFVFSSILIPPMLAQDRSRLAILDLQELPDGAGVTLDRRHWAKIGALVRRRMVDQWPRFAATLERYAIALGDAGHGQRGQDQYGTMLACADLMLFDGIDDDEDDGDRFAEWAQRLNFATLAEAQDEQPDELDAAQHLASSYMHARGGDDRETVARVIGKALRAHDTDMALRSRARLEAAGMRLVAINWTGDKASVRDAMPGQPVYLAIAPRHNVGMRQIFDRTTWQDGVWMQSFRRIKGAVKRLKCKIDGIAIWGVAVPIDAICAIDADQDEVRICEEKGPEA